MKYIILDETRGHVVNESEAYAGCVVNPMVMVGGRKEAKE